MNIEIVVPQVGEAISAARLTQWHKKEGDAVRKGEPLFSVDTDKAILDVEAFADGILGKVLVGPDNDVQPGDVVALLYSEAAGHLPAKESIAPAVDVPSDRAESRAAPKQRDRDSAGDNRSLAVTPKARRLARELGVDLVKLAETKGAQMITEADIRAFGAGTSGGKATLPQT